MKRFLLFLFLLVFAVHAFAAGESDITVQDTDHVNSLNKQAYHTRLSDPAQTIATGQKALAISTKIKLLPWYS